MLGHSEIDQIDTKRSTRNLEILLWWCVLCFIYKYCAKIVWKHVQVLDIYFNYITVLSCAKEACFLNIWLKLLLIIFCMSIKLTDVMWILDYLKYVSIRSYFLIICESIFYNLVYQLLFWPWSIILKDCGINRLSFRILAFRHSPTMYWPLADIQMANYLKLNSYCCYVIQGLLLLLFDRKTFGNLITYIFAC